MAAPARPLYETADSLGAESAVIATVSRSWGLSVVALPRRYVLDYGTYREKRLSGFVEVKCRSHHLSTYPTLLVSAAKWREAQFWKAHGDLSTLLVVSFADDIYWHDLTSAFPVFEHGGRTDRRDREDQEPMLVIPMTLMLPLSTCPEVI